MPQPNTVLPQMYAAPMASGIEPTPMYGLEGLTVPGLGLVGGMAFNMFAMPRVQRIITETGFVPLGLGHDQNVYDTLRKQMYTRTQQLFLAQAARRDREHIYRTLRGLAALSGTAFGSEQQRAAFALADIFTFGAPLLAGLAPDMIESLTGSAGSSVALARQLMDFSRYRIDPVTGRLGASMETLNRLMDVLSKDAFAEAGSTRLLTAGQVGQLYREMVIRGMVPGVTDVPRLGRQALANMITTEPENLAVLTERTIGRRIRTHRDLDRLSPLELDKILDMPEVSDRLRTFDAERVKRTLEVYAKAVAAMRDIFGDMGHPDAPMSRLIGGLEALTMGSLAQLDPSRIGRIARQTYNLARQSGVTLDAALILQQDVGVRAQQLGLAPFAAVTATQGALAFGGAYRALGFASHPAFGAFTADQMTQLDAVLRLQAMQSTAAQHLAVLHRLADSGMTFDPKSPAARMIEAVRRRRTEFELADGRRQSLAMPTEEFVELLRQSGVNASTTLSLLAQREANEAAVTRHQAIASVVRRLQPVEARALVEARLSETLQDQMTARGVTPEAAGRVVDAIAATAAREIFAMRPEDFRDDARRTSVIASTIRTLMQRTREGSEFLNRLTPVERERFLQETATRFYGHVEQFIQQTPTLASTFRSFQNLYAAMHPSVLREAERQEDTAAFTSRLQEALSPLGRGSLTRRLVDAIQQVRPDDPDSLRSVLARAFGGVGVSELRSVFVAQSEELARLRSEFETRLTEFQKTEPGQGRDNLAQELEDILQQISYRATELAKLNEQIGPFVDIGFSARDTARATLSTAEVMRTMTQLSPIHGVVQARPPEDELRRVAESIKPNTLTPEEAAVMIMTQRRQELKKIAREKREEFKRFFEEIKKERPSITEPMAQMLFVEQKAAELTSISPIELQKQIESPPSFDLSKTADREVLAAVARLRMDRNLGGFVERRVEELLREGKVTRQQAFVQAQMEETAIRLGLTRRKEDGSWDDSKLLQAVASGVIHDPKGQVVAVFPPTNDRLDILQRAIRLRENERYVVTDEQVKEWLTAHRVDEKDQPKYVELARTQILKERAAAERIRFDRFWQSPEGFEFRDKVAARQQDIHKVMSGLISSPAAVLRFGPQVIEMYKQFQADQQALATLASLHAKGDLARLLASDFAFDLGDPDKARQALVVRGEVAQILDRQARMVRMLTAAQESGGVWEMLTHPEFAEKTRQTRDMLWQRTAEQLRLPTTITAEELARQPLETVLAFHTRLAQEAERLSAAAVPAAEREEFEKAVRRAEENRRQWQWGSTAETLLMTTNPRLVHWRRLLLSQAVSATIDDAVKLAPRTIETNELLTKLRRGYESYEMLEQDLEKLRKDAPEAHGLIMSEFFRQAAALDDPRQRAQQTTLRNLPDVYVQELDQARQELGALRDALLASGLTPRPGESTVDALRRYQAIAEGRDANVPESRQRAVKQALERLPQLVKGIQAARQIPPSFLPDFKQYAELTKQFEAAAADLQVLPRALSLALSGRIPGRSLQMDSDQDEMIIASIRTQLAEIPNPEKRRQILQNQYADFVARYGGLTAEEILHDTYMPLLEEYLSKDEREKRQTIVETVRQIRTDLEDKQKKRKQLQTALDKEQDADRQQKLGTRLAETDREIEALRVRYESQLQQLQPIARRLGATTTEVLQLRRSANRLTPMTDKERQTVVTAREQIPRLRQQLAQIDERLAGETDKDAKAILLQQRAQVARDLNKLFTELEPIALDRGVTVEQLLRGEAQLDFDRAQRLTELSESIGRSASRLQAAGANAVLTDPEIVRNAVQAFTTLEDQLKQMQRQENRSGEEILKEFQQLFGFTEHAGAEQLGRLGQKLAGTQQRMVVESVMGSQRGLLELGRHAAAGLEARISELKKQRDAIDDDKRKSQLDKEIESLQSSLELIRKEGPHVARQVMLNAYRQAIGPGVKPEERVERMAQFQKTFGLDPFQLALFRQAADLQLSLGVGDYGPGPGQIGVAHLSQILDQILTGGVVRLNETTSGTGNRPTEPVRITGSLRIEGQVGHLDAMTGGALPFVGP